MNGVQNQDVLVNPVRRQRYRLSEADGDLIGEVWTEPGGDVPEHAHPYQEERWEVVSGEVTFRLGRQTQTARVGDVVVAPAGMRHSFQNTGEEEALLHFRVHPALTLRGFFEEATAFARSGKFSQRGVPTGLGAALELADFMQRYQDVMVISRPPRIIQRIFFRPLAAVHRRRNGDASSLAR
jgi:quercetin dioxygenase-like cupin family protein